MARRTLFCLGTVLVLMRTAAPAQERRAEQRFAADPTQLQQKPPALAGPRQNIICGGQDWATRLVQFWQRNELLAFMGLALLAALGVNLRRRSPSPVAFRFDVRPWEPPQSSRFEAHIRPQDDRTRANGA
jgi:hypothetical protein